MLRCAPEGPPHWPPHPPLCLLIPAYANGEFQPCYLLNLQCRAHWLCLLRCEEPCIIYLLSPCTQALESCKCYAGGLWMWSMRARHTCSRRSLSVSLSLSLLSSLSSFHIPARCFAGLRLCSDAPVSSGFPSPCFPPCSCACLLCLPSSLDCRLAASSFLCLASFCCSELALFCSASVVPDLQVQML